MATCSYTCFDRVLHQVNELPKDKLNEAYEIITDYSLSDLLDFGVENECFTREQAQTLYEGIVMWEDLDGNYWEEDEEKYEALTDAMGIRTHDLWEWQQSRD